MLKRPASARTQPGEVEVVVRWLRENVIVLAHLPRAKVEAAAALITARRFAAGEIIRRTGFDNRFYVVLSGKVGLGSDAGLDDTVAAGLENCLERERQRLPAKSSPSRSPGAGVAGARAAAPPAVPSPGSPATPVSDRARSASVSMSPPSASGAAAPPSLPEKPIVLEQAGSFGYFDLVQSRLRDLPATALCESWVLIMDNERYRQAVHHHDSAEWSSNVDFLLSLKLFSAWSRSRLMRLASVMKHCVYPPGECITRQGDPPRYMFFIKRGTCTVSRDNVKHHCTRWPASKTRWETRKWTTVESIELGTLSTGMYFGEAAIFRGEPRFANVTSTSVLELLALHSRYFLHLLPEHTLERLKERQQLYAEDMSIQRQYEVLQRRYEAARDPVTQILRRTRLMRSASVTTAASAFGTVVGDGGGGEAADGETPATDDAAAAKCNASMQRLVAGAVSGFRRRRAAKAAEAAEAAEAAKGVKDTRPTALQMARAALEESMKVSGQPPSMFTLPGVTAPGAAAAAAGAPSNAADAADASASPLGDTMPALPPVSPIAHGGSGRPPTMRNRRNSIGESTRLRLMHLKAERMPLGPHDVPASPDSPVLRSSPRKVQFEPARRRSSVVFPLL